jgi:HD superfamily phosphohydrolase
VRSAANFITVRLNAKKSVYKHSSANIVSALFSSLLKNAGGDINAKRMFASAKKLFLLTNATQ